MIADSHWNFDPKGINYIYLYMKYIRTDEGYAGRKLNQLVW